MGNARNSDGEIVALDDWNLSQAHTALEWSLTEGMETHERIMVWADFFAACTRELCRIDGVPVDVYHDRMARLMEEIIPHIQKHKWFLSETKGDVGLCVTAMHISCTIDRSDPREPVLEVRFPPLKEGEKGHVTKRSFPALKQVA